MLDNNRFQHPLKRVKQEMKESERRFRALVEASSEVLYSMSPEWTEMRELHSHNRFPSDTEEPSRDWIKRYIHPDDQAFVMSAITKAIETKSTFELEHRVKRAGGTWGYTFSRAVPLLDEDGEIEEWFGAAIDVTEGRMAEEALRKSEGSLKTSLAEKEVLLKEVHHRVKNCIQIISSLICLQASEIQDPSIRATFTDLFYRVRSMAAIHEKLYQSENMSEVDFSDYAKSLMAYLWRAFGAAAPGAASLRRARRASPLSA